MLKIRFKFICFFLAFSCIGNIFAATFNFGSKSSAIKVGHADSCLGKVSISGGNLSINDGTLLIDHPDENPNLPFRADTATTQIEIEGSFFDVKDYNGNVHSSFLNYGRYLPSTQKICLENEAGSLQSEYGKVLPKIEVNYDGFVISGQPIFLQSITLQDSSISLTLALQSKLNKDIEMNGGILFLRDDLMLADDVQLRGGGRVQLNNRRISLGGKNITWTDDVQWEEAGDIVLNNNMTLNCTWTFEGNGVLNGNGYALTLGNNGKILVYKNHSSVLFHDIKIEGIAGTNIRCFDHTGTLSFSNLTWVQDRMFTFTEGRFVVVADTKMQNSSRYKNTPSGGDGYAWPSFNNVFLFGYGTDQVSTILSNARLTWDIGFTFSYGPLGTDNRRLIQMTDKSSEIFMNGATLAATTTGLVLTKGTMIFDHKNYFYNQDPDRAASALDESIQFGEGGSGAYGEEINDLDIVIMPSASIELLSGVLYHNCSPAEFIHPGG